MTDEPSKKTSADDINAAYVLENKRDIDILRNKVSDFLRQELNFEHKVDKLGIRLGHIEEGFSHARVTSHKTWEMVQKIQSDQTLIFEQTKNQLNSHSEKIEKLERSDKTGSRVDWIMRSLLGILFAIATGAALKYFFM